MWEGPDYVSYDIPGKVVLENIRKQAEQAFWSKPLSSISVSLCFISWFHIPVLSYINDGLWLEHESQIKPFPNRMLLLEVLSQQWKAK